MTNLQGIKIFEAIKQIEEITQHNSIDLELINTAKKLPVQARPLIKDNNKLQNIAKEKFLLIKEMRRFHSE